MAGRLRKQTIGALTIAAALCWAGLSGCGTEVTAFGTGGTGTGGTGTGGTATGGGGDGGTTLDNVCELLASQICAGRESCCESAQLGFDPMGCEAHETAQCQTNVADVEAGTMTFDPSHIDACLAALQPFLDMCLVGVADKIAMIDARQLCRTIFEGTAEIGEPCERHAQCAPAAAPEDLSHCDGDAGQCAIFDLLAADETCTIGGGMQTFCADGLFCDAEITGPPPFTGTCQPATPLGQPCAASAQVPSFECGTGYLCSLGSGTCEVAKEPGAPCNRPFECRSLECTPEHVCGRLDLLVDSEACTGTP